MSRKRPSFAALFAAVLFAGCASEPKPEPAPAPATAAGDCCETKGDCCASTAAGAKTAAKPEPAKTAPKTGPKAATGPEYVTRGPKAFADPAAFGIGKPVKDVAFRDIDGKHCSLAALREGHKAVVVLFTSLGCPVTRNYAPTLATKLSPWTKRGVAIVFVNPSIAEELVDITASRDRLKWNAFTVTQDPDYAWSDALGARRTSDTFVIDAQGVLRYRGPIDDRIGINYQRTTARRHHLTEALEAVLAQKPVKLAALEAPGCVLSRVKLPKTN